MLPGSREEMSGECSVRVLEAMQCKMRDRETAKLDYSVGLNQLESLVILETKLLCSL